MSLAAAALYVMAYKLMPSKNRRIDPNILEPYWQRLPRLRHEAGLSQTELFRAAEGVGLDTIRALEQPWGRPTDAKRARARYPSADTLERLSPPLKVKPAEFPEYRLAKARELLDERAQGMADALINLYAFDRALARLARRESAPDSDTGRQRPTGEK